MTFDPDLERDIQIESKYDAWLEKAEFDFDLDASCGYIEEQVREATTDAPRSRLAPISGPTATRSRSGSSTPSTMPSRCWRPAIPGLRLRWRRPRWN